MQLSLYGKHSLSFHSRKNLRSETTKLTNEFLLLFLMQLYKLISQLKSGQESWWGEERAAEISEGYDKHQMCCPDILHTTISHSYENLQREVISYLNETLLVMSACISVLFNCEGMLDVSSLKLILIWGTFQSTMKYYK